MNEVNIILEHERRIITNLWEEKWHLIEDDIEIKVDRILLPWFPNWLKWDDESWLYKIKDARETFWNRLPNSHQFNELWDYLWLLDIEDVFHQVLNMNSTLVNPYFIDSSINWPLERLSRQVWFKWTWYQLITSDVFWPHMDKLWERWTETTNWPITHIKVWTIKALEKDFKVRLQWN